MDIKINIKGKLLLLLFISIIINSCINKIGSKHYIKTDKKNIYKIDYDSHVDSSNNQSIVISFSEQLQTLNPYRAASSSEIFFKNALFSSLFYIDPGTGTPKNNLIKNYSIIQNGLEYYFALKNNIKFSSNKILTTKDIISSLNLLNTVLKDTYIYNNFFIKNKKLDIEPLSSLEFLIKLDEPNSNILYALANFPIIPEKTANDLSNDIEKFINYWDIKNSSSIIGSGPYKLEKIDESGSLLRKNNNYFNTNKKGIQLPLTPNLEIKFYSNRNNEIIGFIQNETDILFLDENNFNNLYDYFNKKNKDNVKFINTGVKRDKVILAFNSYSPGSKSYLKDNKIREYLSSLIKKEFKTSGKKQIEKTKSINIDSSLFSDNNNDGVLEYKDGSTIFLKFLVPEEDRQLVITAKKIKKNIESLGFDAYLDIVPFHSYLEKLFYKIDYDIALFYYSIDPGIISYFHLLDKKELTFYPFIDDNNLTSNELDNLFDEFFAANSIKKQSNSIKKITELLEKKHQLQEVYSENQYYIIKNDIFNFKINSSMEDSFNLNTLENIIKIKENNK